LLDRAKLFGISSSKRNDTMLRQFSSRLPARARASCSRALGQASRFSLVPRRSMATVKVEGIPKV
jgi:processing peptidase subunit alpha